MTADRIEKAARAYPCYCLPGPARCDDPYRWCDRPMTPADRIECTCGPGTWGTCDQCGVNAWIKHHCPFPCDDVTCEDGSICIGCLTGRPCLMHNGPEEDW